MTYLGAESDTKSNSPLTEPVGQGLGGAGAHCSLMSSLPGGTLRSNRVTCEDGRALRCQVHKFRDTSGYPHGGQPWTALGSAPCRGESSRI